MVAYMNVISNMLFRASLSHDVDPVTAGITVINHPLNRTHYQMARHLLYDHVSFLLLNLSRLCKPFCRFLSSFSQCVDILEIITFFVITITIQLSHGNDNCVVLVLLRPPVMTVFCQFS